MQWQPWMLGFREGMYYMLTGDNMSGTRAAELGFANEAVPAAELDAKVLDVAARVAIVPSDLQMVNKRSVHRQMEAMGIRNGLRVGTELQALATYTRVRASCRSLLPFPPCPASPPWPSLFPSLPRRLSLPSPPCGSPRPCTNPTSRSAVLLGRRRVTGWARSRRVVSRQRSPSAMRSSAITGPEKAATTTGPLPSQSSERMSCHSVSLSLPLTFIRPVKCLVAVLLR